MPPIEGVDFSATPPGAAALKAAGKAFACRYLALDSRGLTAAEIADYKANGIALVLIYETDGLGFRSGQVTANIDAADAQGHIVRLGLPANAPVYFTVDDQFNPGDQAGLAAYLATCAQVLGSVNRVGIYGPLAAVEYAASIKAARYFWQTSGWSGIPPVWFSGNHLEQYGYNVIINGTNCDATRALTADYGQIGGASAAPSPAPKPVVAYPEGMDAGVAKFAFGSFKASNGITVEYSEGEALSMLWLASGSYGRIENVLITNDQPTRRYWKFSDGRIYWTPNDNEPIRLMK